MKNIWVFLSENFKFLEVRFSIYLNRLVFVMLTILLYFELVNFITFWFGLNTVGWAANSVELDLILFYFFFFGQKKEKEKKCIFFRIMICYLQGRVCGNLTQTRVCETWNPSHSYMYFVKSNNRLIHELRMSARYPIIYTATRWLIGWLAGWLVWSLMAQSTLLRSCWDSQFT